MANETVNDYDGGSEVYLPIIHNANDYSPRVLSALASANFDGAIPYEIVNNATPDNLEPGVYFEYLDEYHLITRIEDVLDSADPPNTVSYNLWYVSGGAETYRNIPSGSTVFSDGLPLNIKRELWGERVVGEYGWMISAEGNAIFSNVAVRGEINATSGVFDGYVSAGNMLIGTDVSGTNDGIYINSSNYWYADGTMSVGGNSTFTIGSGTSAITYNPATNVTTIGSGVIVNGDISGANGTFTGNVQANSFSIDANNYWNTNNLKNFRVGDATKYLFWNNTAQTLSISGSLKATSLSVNSNEAGNSTTTGIYWDGNPANPVYIGSNVNILGGLTATSLTIGTGSNLVSISDTAVSGEAGIRIGSIGDFIKTTGAFRLGGTNGISYSGAGGNVVISGFTVGADRLYAGSGASFTGVGTSTYSIFAGATSNTGTNAKFSVTPAGDLFATSGTIAGWNLATSTLYSTQSVGTTVGLSTGTTSIFAGADNNTGLNAKFSVTNAGVLTATSGLIGGWNLTSSLLYTGALNSTTLFLGLNSSTTTGAYSIYAGHSTAASAPFSVTNTGVLKTTSGTIGGWTLTPTTISTGTGTSKITLNTAGGSGSTALISIGTGSHGSSDTGFYADGAGLFSLSNQLIFTPSTGTGKVDVKTTATFSNGGTTMTVASATGITKGMTVIAIGVQTFTYVTGVSGTTITLSLPTTAAGSSVSVTFSMDDMAELQVNGRIKGVVESTSAIAPPRLTATTTNVAVSGAIGSQFATITTNGHAFQIGEKVKISGLPYTNGIDILNSPDQYWSTITEVSDSVTLKVAFPTVPARFGSGTIGTVTTQGSTWYATLTLSDPLYSTNTVVYVGQTITCTSGVGNFGAAGTVTTVTAIASPTSITITGQKSGNTVGTAGSVTAIKLYPLTTAATTGTIALSELTMGYHPAEGVAGTGPTDPARDSFYHSAGTGARLDKYNWWFTNNQFRVGTLGTYLKWDGSSLDIKGGSSKLLKLSIGASDADVSFSIATSGVTPSWNNSSTPFYVNALGQFSILNRLKFDPTTSKLTLSGGNSGGTYSLLLGSGPLVADNRIAIYDPSVPLGEPEYGQSTTPFFVDGTGKFSLGNKLTWSGTALTIDGSVTIGSTTGSTIVSGAASGSTSLQPGTAANDVNNGVTYIVGGKIRTGILESTGYSYSSGNYSTTGTQIHLDNGTIRAQKFYINGITGDAYFAGSLNAATGTFSGDISAASGTFTGALSGSTITGGIIRTSANTGNGSTSGIILDSTSARFYNSSSSTPVTTINALTGVLTATGASITGTINASSGTIGEWGLYTNTSRTINDYVNVRATDSLISENPFLSATSVIENSVVSGVKVALLSTNTANHKESGIYIWDTTQSELDYAFFGSNGLKIQSAPTFNAFIDPGYEDSPAINSTYPHGITSTTNYTTAIIDLTIQSNPKYLSNNGALAIKTTWTTPSGSYLYSKFRYKALVDKALNNSSTSKILSLAFDAYFNQTINKSILSSISVASTSPYLITVTTTTAHGLVVGDLVMLDFTATDNNGDGTDFAERYSTSGESMDSHVHVVNTVVDLTTFTVVNNYTLSDPANNFFTAPFSLDWYNDNIGGQKYVYRLYQPYLNMLEARIRFSNGQTVPLYDILATTQQPDFKLMPFFWSDPNNYSYDYAIDGYNYGFENTMSFNISASKLYQQYSAKDSTGLLSAADIYFDIPAYLYDGKMNSTYSEIVAPNKKISSITWLSSVATVTTSTPHYLVTGNVVSIYDAIPAGYNGNNYTVTVTGTNTFTYALASNPGTYTVNSATVYGPKLSNTSDSLGIVLDNHSLSEKGYYFSGGSGAQYQYDDGPTFGNYTDYSIKLSEPLIDYSLSSDIALIADIDYVSFKNYYSNPLFDNPYIQSALYGIDDIDNNFNPVKIFPLSNSSDNNSIQINPGITQTPTYDSETSSSVTGISGAYTIALSKSTLTGTRNDIVPADYVSGDPIDNGHYVYGTGIAVGAQIDYVLISGTTYTVRLTKANTSAVSGIITFRQVTGYNQMEMQTNNWMSALDAGFEATAIRSRLDPYGDRLTYYDINTDTDLPYPLNKSAISLYINNNGTSKFNVIADTAFIKDSNGRNSFQTGSTLSISTTYTTNANYRYRSEGTDFTSTSTTYTYYSSKRCNMYFTTGASGNVMIFVGGKIQSNASSETGYLSYEVREGSASGTIIIAASDTRAASVQNNNTVDSSNFFIYSLKPNTSYYIEALHKTTSGGTIYVYDRKLMVIPLV